MTLAKPARAAGILEATGRALRCRFIGKVGEMIFCRCLNFYPFVVLDGILVLIKSRNAEDTLGDRRNSVKEEKQDR